MLTVIIDREGIIYGTTSILLNYHWIWLQIALIYNKIHNKYTCPGYALAKLLRNNFLNNFNFENVCTLF